MQLIVKVLLVLEIFALIVALGLVVLAEWQRRRFQREQDAFKAFERELLERHLNP